jgi:sugar phosphate isomerase/epimerase
MRIGLGTYAYAWAIGVPGYPPKKPLPVFEFLDRASMYGFDCIQIGDNLPLHLFTDDQLMTLRDEADQLGIAVEVGMRGLIKTMVLKYLDIATQLNSNILRIVIDTGDYRPAIPEIIQIIREILPALKEKNIKLAVENHDRFTANEFRQIVKDTDEDWVGICLDSVNSLGKGEGFFEVVQKLLPYTINLHIKDYIIKRLDHQMGFCVSGTIAGQGMLPIKWLLDETRKYGKCHSAILELWPPPEKDIEATIRKEELWVGESINVLRGIIGRQ